MQIEHDAPLTRMVFTCLYEDSDLVVSERSMHSCDLAAVAVAAEGGCECSSIGIRDKVNEWSDSGTCMTAANSLSLIHI